MSPNMSVNTDAGSLPSGVPPLRGFRPRVAGCTLAKAHIDASRNLQQKRVTALGSATSQGRLLVWVLLLLAIICAVLGMRAWVNPLPLPLPSAGPLRWIASAAYEMGGAGGIAVLWFAVSAALGVAARWAWRHTPKIPSDRWWRR